MSYEPTVWKTGDIVSSEKLNKLENGVANSGGDSGAVLVWIYESQSAGSISFVRVGNLVCDSYEPAPDDPEENVTVATQLEMFNALKQAVFSGRNLVLGTTLWNASTVLHNGWYIPTPPNYRDLFRIYVFRGSEGIQGAYEITKENGSDEITITNMSN